MVMPFQDQHGNVLTGEAPGVGLTQVSATRFALSTTFSYTRQNDGLVIDVLPAHLQDTDLASIPAKMRWFVPRYGLHTLAALMHDQLVKSGVTTPGVPTRRDADRLFYDAMGDLGVPIARRQIMWAAVTARTRWGSGLKPQTTDYGWPARIGLVAWMLCALAGIGAFWIAGLEVFFDAGRPWGWSPFVFFAISAALPFAAMFLWGRDRFQGLVGTYGFVLVVIPTLFAYIFYGGYLLFEKVSGWIRTVRN